MPLRIPTQDKWDEFWTNATFFFGLAFVIFIFIVLPTYIALSIFVF